MHSLGSISAIASEKNIFLYFPHIMVLYKIYVFYSDMKFKMAATAGLSLTLDPMGKMFQNASSLKPNCPGMIIST
jgi:hypothetical protein